MAYANGSKLRYGPPGPMRKLPIASLDTQEVAVGSSFRFYRFLIYEACPCRSTRISTRRFFWRFASVSFGAIGCVSA